VDVKTAQTQGATASLTILALHESSETVELEIFHQLPLLALNPLKGFKFPIFLPECFQELRLKRIGRLVS